MRSSSTLSNRILTHSTLSRHPLPPAFHSFHSFSPKANNNNASASIHVHLGVSYRAIQSHPFPPSIPNHPNNQKPHSRQKSTHPSVNQSTTHHDPQRIRLFPILPSYPTGSLPLPATATATVASSALRRGDAGLRGEIKRVPIWIWVRCSEAGVGV